LSLLLTIAICLCAFLAWKLRRVKHVVKNLIQSIQHSSPTVIGEPGILTRNTGLDQLTSGINNLLNERDTMSGAGQAYHSQIQALLGNLREAVVMVDHDNTIVSVNPALRELTGTEEDPAGKRLDMLIHGTAFLEFIQRVQKTGKGQFTEIKVLIGNASRWLEVSAAPLDKKPGQGSQYTLFIFQDITRQKQLEKMRSEFVANVSHELRTPVTIIKGFAEALKEDDDVLEPAEKKRFLEKIERNTERLDHLLQDLLLLARLESTDSVLQLESVSLQDFLKDFVEHWTATPDMGALKSILDVEGSVTIPADPLRLSQVLTNLLENVRRHAKGATQVRISTRISGEFLVLAIEDNGMGIPEKDLPHIFQRFFRVDKGRSRESGGTGLGLAIVKHIVAQHGGEIRARSREGEGTCVEVLLPLGEPSSVPSSAE
jgi:two-component system phosphate regulon sensor histidine kinase PhoR